MPREELEDLAFDLRRVERWVPLLKACEERRVGHQTHVARVASLDFARVPTHAPLRRLRGGELLAEPLRAEQRARAVKPVEVLRVLVRRVCERLIAVDATEVGAGGSGAPQATVLVV